MDLIQVLAANLPEVCSDVPPKIFDIVSKVITAIKFGVPVLLIIFGMLDLGKAVIASKEDEIKKGQQMFIKRTITAVIVFFVVVVVQLVVGLASDDKNVWTCVQAFINGVEDTGVSNTGTVIE